jgi:hypothetical protein
VGGITIRDLNIYAGSGNAGSGIVFRNQSSASLGAVSVSNVEIKNFGAKVSSGDIGSDQGRGVLVFVASSSGYLSQFTLQNSEVHHCAVDGVVTESVFPLHRIGNVTIRNNKVHDNTGISTYTKSHSGSGIIVGGVYSARVERNVSYELGSPSIVRKRLAKYARGRARRNLGLEREQCHDSVQ